MEIVADELGAESGIGFWQIEFSDLQRTGEIEFTGIWKNELDLRSASSLHPEESEPTDVC